MQIRAFVQQDPSRLPAVMQELARAQPELVQRINANRNDFYLFLNTPIPSGGPGGRAPPGAIQVTPEENAAIERLAALVGCPKQVAAEAFLICDRNENLAANYLFENAGAQ